MKIKTKPLLTAFTMFIFGLLIGFSGIYVGEVDDAPGVAAIGILLMIGLIIIGFKSILRKY